MTCQGFVKFLEHFVLFAQPNLNRKHLIIMDNHESHCSLEAIHYARDHGIVFLTIPPHTSHKLQPLDRTVFGPLKKYYSQAASNFMLRCPGRVITIYDIAELLGDAFPRAVAPTNIISGFKVSGIWPINPNIFSDDEYMTSAVTDRPEQIAIELQALELVLPSTSAATPEPCIQGPSTLDLHYSPQDIMPFPKAQPRVQSTRGRKRGRSRILTDTPEKNEIEDITLKKTARNAAATKRAEKKMQQIRKAELKFSDDEDDEDLPSLPDSSGGSDFISHDELDQIEDAVPESDDFVLVKFRTKKTIKFYVGRVLSAKETTPKVKFLRRKGLSGSSFSYPLVEDISEVEKEDAQKLPQSFVKGTARTADIIKFRYKFDSNVF